MDEVLGQKFIFAVAQRAFEAASEAGTYNQFCVLLPLFDPDGEIANPQDFPDNGDVWWMVLPNVRGLAEPGRLVTGTVEYSMRKGEPGRAQYQVVADTVEPVRGRNYVEILDVPSSEIVELRELVGSKFRLALDHPPLDTAYVRWRDLLLGPFRTASEPEESAGSWSVRLEPSQTDKTVLRLTSDLLDVIPRGRQLKGSVDISLESRPLQETRHPHHCQYHLVETEATAEAVPADTERVSMKTDGQIIKQLAKRLLTRSKRQELVNKLKELDSLADTASESVELEEQQVLKALRDGVASETKAVGRIAQAIVQSKIIEDQIQEALAERAEKHIADNAARLQAEANKRVEETRSQLETLQRQASRLEAELQQKAKQGRDRLQRELEQERKEFDAQLDEEAQSLSKERLELERQRQVLSENLKKVASTLSSNRDEVVNQFLTIAPLLSQLDLLPRSPHQGPQPPAPHAGRAAPPPAADEKSADGKSEPEFEIPSFAGRHGGDDLSEEEFFERFLSYAEQRGFRYRRIDLLSYHVSTKCGDLTILGGLPGTGKSSLPRLYADAVAGAEAGDPVRRFLHVAVSPSWLDMRDLLGHVNALNRTFQPADSSLFQHLVLAEEEFRQIEDDSRLYFVCLDEMNLSHVEHYFSGLLQVLEHPEGHRRLRCFPDNVVSPASPFARWAAINVPQSVRFAGTVNFDETTKQLSQRLLDRVNLVRLPSDQLPLELDESTTARLDGPPVLLRHYRSWVRRTASYSDELASLIDGLRDSLRVLNSPMNPRRFSAIRTFLASWPGELEPVERAIDLQLAQRVLPQIRGLFQPGARDALDAIQRTLDQHAIDFPESLRLLDALRRSEQLEFGGYQSETTE